MQQKIVHSTLKLVGPFSVQKTPQFIGSSTMYCVPVRAGYGVRYCGIKCKPEAAPDAGAESLLVNLCRHLHVSELLIQNKTCGLSFAQKKKKIELISYLYFETYFPSLLSNQVRDEGFLGKMLLFFSAPKLFFSPYFPIFQFSPISSQKRHQYGESSSYKYSSVRA